MALDEHTKGRLRNWKFWSAQAALERQIGAAQLAPTADEISTINALSSTFGDCGWFESHLGSVVNAAVRFLLSESPESVEWSRSISNWRYNLMEWFGKMPPPPDA